MKNKFPHIQEESGQRLVSCTREMTGSKWKVDHKFNTERILVMLLDDDLNDIFPYSIRQDGLDEVIAEMSGDTVGYMTIIKMTPILKGRTVPVNGESSYTYTHRLGTTFLMTQCWDSDFNLVIPKEITYIDDEMVTVTFDKPFNGSINIVRPVPSSFTINDPDATWEDRYSSRLYRQLIASQLSDGYQVFFPQSIKRLDKSVLATLNQNETGNMNSILHGYRT